MNKDIDNINNTDESVEKALDAMESAAEISDEQLREILEDEESLQICRDIMDSSLFLQQKNRAKLPNVDMELERFKKKQYSLHRRSILWKTGIGIAAMVAILFGAYYFIDTLATSPSNRLQYSRLMLLPNISFCKRITEKRLC